jgi:ADP-L-glycero-D-manno-heptose 6-epimerase
VYGYGEEEKYDQASPVSKFKKQIIKTGNLELFEGSDNFYRDFINVDDVVSIVLNNKNTSGIYDLGTSKPISFKQVAEEVANKFNGNIIEIPFPSHLKGKYQSYTCAKNEWKDFNFRTTKQFLNES